MPAILELTSVRQAFRKGEAKQAVVLEDVNLELREGEIVALLGKSGSGKSTLLRIIAGLIKPTAGEVKLADANVAMVFQNFALFPWLTVLENVELGLEAQRLPRKEIRKRALEAIDLIGLDGYESAYPRELSGGMKQRVGLARALVVNPELLLMDEPFSALDVLTAETLKSDFLDLWLEKKMSLKSVLLVTHNIEEAVMLADRILVVSSSPGRIVGEVKVKLPHPRDWQSQAFADHVENIYTVMTTTLGGGNSKHGAKQPEISLFERLPRVSPNQLAGLMESLAEPPFKGRADIPALHESLSLDTDDLLHIIEALRLLRLAEVAEGDIALNPIGHAFVAGDTQQRKLLFAEALTRYIPLAAYIRKVLGERPDNSAPRVRFLTMLEDNLSESEAEEVLTAVTSWARYAELFSYNDNTEVFSLENPTA